MMDIQEYLDSEGRSPFRVWFNRLNADAARRVTTAVYRLGLGNFSTSRVLAPGFSNTELISVLGTACISAKTAKRLSFFLRAGPSTFSRRTSSKPLAVGETTNKGKGQAEEVLRWR